MVLAKTQDEKVGKSFAEYELNFDTNDKTGMVKEIERKARYALRRDTPFREEANEDFKFALGDQWTPEERTTLKDEGRPCLTFNKIEPLIDLVGGWQRENSARIRIFPEGGEDKIFSEIGDRCVKYFDKTTKLNYKMDHQFDDGIVCGKGWLEMAISYDNDPIFGQLIFRNDTIFQILVDPDGEEYDLSDREYVIKVTKRSKSQLIKQFPEKETVIKALTEDTTAYLIMDVLKEGDKDNYHLGKTPQEVSELTAISGGPEKFEEIEKFLLKEYYHKRYVPKIFVFDVGNNHLENFDTEDAANARAEQIKKEAREKFEEAHRQWQDITNVSKTAQMAAGQKADLPIEPVPEEVDVKVIKRQLPQMHYAAEAAGFLMQEPVRSQFAPQYEGFPIFPYQAKKYISATDPRYAIKGITRNVKDANREINKSRSQFLHIINTTANSGWIGDRDALTSQGWKDLKVMGSVPGVTLKKKPNRTLERIQPAGTHMANILRGDKAAMDIKDISGINPDAMAIQDKTTSGRAISLRIKQALTILAKYFRNFRYTKELVGTALFAVIPTVLNVSKIRKILGEDFMVKNKIDDGKVASFLAQVKNGKYNMSITEADNTATVRQETFQDLMELAKTGYPIPPDVILEFSAMPNSKEIIERVKEYITQQAAAAPAKPA